MEKVKNSNVLVVGAGGIGCELLKNLVMWNFTNITVIDLDTIDLSNLNRQFLFRKKHIGKSKSLTAKESVLQFNPKATIEALCDDITNPKFNVDFYKKFNVVLNALDNRTARNHVNRMCLRTNVPLIEGGTTGYRGQVQVILKGKTACYECYPKPTQKQYPACTIRNTPSEPIHCVVWSKFLFNQLFGEPDADEDVVPDQNDPELLDIATESGDRLLSNNKQSPKINVRSAWITEKSCDPSLLLKILFQDSIKSLISMKALWSKNNRVQPDILTEADVKCDVQNAKQYVSSVTDGVRDQNLFTLTQWCEIFKYSATKLYEQFTKSDESLIWDKDDPKAMDFVAAAANIRMALFHIMPLQNRFQIKSMAGNIIPAIATTNAMIAGISVLHAYKVVNGEADKCLDVMVSDFVSARGRIVQAVEPQPPVDNCYVCGEQNMLTLSVPSVSSVSLQQLQSILHSQMRMMAPTVSILNKPIILIDGGEEEDEVDPNYLQKSLNEFGVLDETILKCSDFLQEYEFNLEIKENEKNEESVLEGNVEGILSTAKSETVNHEISSVNINSRKRKTSDNPEDVDNLKPNKIMKLVNSSNEMNNDDDDDDDDDLEIIE